MCLSDSYLICSQGALDHCNLAIILMFPSNQTERRKSMEFIIKSINPRSKVLPRLQDEKGLEGSNLRFSRKDVLSYNPMYVDREPLRIYKKPILFQLNFEYNRTIYPRKVQERDYKQLRRLEVNGYDRNNLLLVTVGNRKSLNQPEQAPHSFQQKISQALLTKSELLTATPMTNSMPISSMQFEESQPPISYEQMQRSICKATSPEKRKNLEFDNSDGTFKFFVGPGNNGQLVKTVLEKRGNWTETSESNSMFNLKWTQTCDKLRFDSITSDSGHKQIVNHFEYHEEISTKSGLLRNLRSFCERDQKNNLFEITPLTFEVDFTAESCDQELKRFLFFYLENTPWRNQLTKPKRKEEDRKSFMDFLKAIKPIHNVQNLTYEKKEHPNSKAVMKDIYTDGDTYLWLLKPTGLNRGRGIYLFRNLEELAKIFEQYFQKNEKILSNPRSPSRRHSSAKQKPRESESSTGVAHSPYIRSQSFVIQKYIERPMLIRSRKYDIRVWVLLSHQMDLYFFKEGYIRTSCEQYNLQKNDLYVHLTNNAVQKNSSNYGTYEKGNQLSFDDLQQIFNELDKTVTPAQVSTLQPIPAQDHDNVADTPILTEPTPPQTPPEKISFRKHILPDLKKMVTVSIESVKKKINENDRRFCFQIYGYDFMIDDNLKPWLIEVNTNPCIEESSPILEKLLPRMLHNAFQLTLDVLLPGKIKQNHPKPKYHVDGYSDDENMWEFLANYRTQRRKLRK